MNEAAYTKEEVYKARDGFPERGLLCHLCKVVIPQFADLSATDESRLRNLISQGRPILAMAELRQITGCSILWARIWVIHEWHPGYLNKEAAPCPYCGKPLRTPLAKQCRFCKRDWHEEC